ncbi:MAG: hypothetical protein BRD51_01335 [Bacteroidetes bacterium SW_11_64_17]|nr:MAG: hypothetical protein BRD51_01335 [Bacteroidetes bacterium SW_11_64_17]
MKRLSFLLSLVLCFLAWSPSALAQTTPTGPVSQMNGFSRALDIEADRVFVGEPQNIHTPGRVYVYEKEGGSWTESTYLEAEDGEVGDGFGSALDAAGEQVAVGASSANSVYLYGASMDGWSQTVTVTAADSTSGFGRSVILEGDRLFVGTSTTVSPSNEQV